MKAMNGIIQYGCAPKAVFKTQNNKFPQEKVCFENDDLLIHFDGIILNSDDLKAELGCGSNQEILQNLYQTYGAELVFRVKGLYALVLWDKKAGTLLITNDLLSKRPVYYCMGDNELYYAVSYLDMLDLLSGNSHKPNINADALHDMVRQGFVSGSKTYLKDVRFLNAFESIVVDLKRNHTQLIRHSMKAVEIPDTEDAVIDKFDALFSEAVRLQFRKNAEYGYTQCATVSGGMDSRACLLKAHRLGFDKDIVCFNYAQSGSLDFTISRQIAVDLGLDYVFYPMDAAVFLDRLPEAMYCNECMQSGIGATGSRTMSALLNTSNFGIVNIGICGGELMGDLVRRNRQQESGNKLIRFANRIIRKIKEQTSTEIPKAENFLLNQDEYFNHLRASKNFAHMFIDQCECVSPFMDEDVVMYVLQLNPGLCFNRRMYRKWMCKHIPNSYIITSTCTTVDASYWQELLSGFKYSIQQKFKGISQREMNPIAHWFETQPHHAQNCIREYEQGCRWLEQVGCDGQLTALLQKGWGGSWMQRLYVLTAVQALKDIYTRFNTEH